MGGRRVRPGWILFLGHRGAEGGPGRGRGRRVSGWSECTCSRTRGVGPTPTELYRRGGRRVRPGGPGVRRREGRPGGTPEGLFGSSGAISGRPGRPGFRVSSPPCVWKVSAGPRAERCHVVVRKQVEVVEKYVVESVPVPDPRPSLSLLRVRTPRSGPRTHSPTMSTHRHRVVRPAVRVLSVWTVGVVPSGSPVERWGIRRLTSVDEVGVLPSKKAFASSSTPQGGEETDLSHRTHRGVVVGPTRTAVRPCPVGHG